MKPESAGKLAQALFSLGLVKPETRVEQGWLEEAKRLVHEALDDAFTPAVANAIIEHEAGHAKAAIIAKAQQMAPKVDDPSAQALLLGVQVAKVIDSDRVTPELLQEWQKRCWVVPIKDEYEYDDDDPNAEDPETLVAHCAHCGRLLRVGDAYRLCGASCGPVGIDCEEKGSECCECPEY